MGRQAGPPLGAWQRGAVPRARPRVPGEDGAMAWMDGIADLVRRFRFLHHPARSEWQTAADVLSWVEDELPGELADRLVFCAAFDLATHADDLAMPGVAPEPQAGRLSDGLAEAIVNGTGPWLQDTWRSWSAADRHALLARGLVAFARAMPTDEYLLSYHSGDAHQSRVLVLVGWIPGLLAALIGGPVVAILTGNVWLLPLVSLAGFVLGCLATLGLWCAAVDADRRWHLFGPRWWSVFALIVLGTGPAIVLLVAVAALNLPASLAIDIDIDPETLADVARRLAPLGFVIWLIGWLQARRGRP